MNEGLNRGLRIGRQYGQRLEDRESNMIEGITAKLEVARKFQNIFEELQDKKIGIQEFKDKARGLLESLLKNLLPDLLLKYEEVLKLDMETDTIFQQVKALPEPDYGEDGEEESETEKRRSSLFDSLDAARDKMQGIWLSDQNLDFALTIKFALDHISKGAARVAKYVENPDLCMKDLAEETHTDPGELASKRSRVRIEFSPISANVILGKGMGIEEYFGNGEEEEFVGMHIRNTFINIIKTTEDIDETIKHENEHILTDAFERHFASMGPPIASFTLALRENTPPQIREKYVDDILSDNGRRFGPTRLINDSYYEIITALQESTRLKNFLKSTQSGEEPKALTGKELGSATHIMSTAGHQIFELNSALKMGTGAENLKLKKKVNQIRLHYIKNLQRELGTLGFAYKMAEEFGAKAREDVDLLIYLLKPSQFHHIPLILIYKYGK